MAKSLEEEEQEAYMAEGLEDWQKEELWEAERTARNARETVARNLAKQLARIDAALELKKRVIPALREKPKAIFGTDNLFIHSENYLLAHDVAGALGIKLEREAESDGINYKGHFGEIPIYVYGMETAPGCKIVRKKVMEEVEKVELVCDGKEASS